MIEVIKENKKLGKDVICYASHSNSRILCDRERNLTDRELEEIKNVNGLVGVFSNINFVSNENNLTYEEKCNLYLKHISHIENIVGMDNVMLSTDDMKFIEDIDIKYADSPIYDYKNIYLSVVKTLNKKYNLCDIEKIMYKNAYEKIINKLNSNTKTKK